MGIVLGKVLVTWDCRIWMFKFRLRTCVNNVDMVIIADAPLPWVEEEKKREREIDVDTTHSTHVKDQ